MRTVEILVKPASKTDLVEIGESNKLVVKVKAPAKMGKANLAVEKLLTKHFGASVKIIKGKTSKNKVVMIDENP